ncbi:MAG: hypothetical protein ABI599_10595 [Flavobacteriales bacterium]
MLTTQRRIPNALCILLIPVSMSNASAQQVATSGEHALDFWLGEWDLTWNDTVHGTNSIVLEMDGKVIAEHFYDPANKYRGGSWSVYNTKTGVWNQTWVDNQAGYIALTGGPVEDRFVFSTAPQLLEGVMTTHRMVFFNITKDAFDWDWQKTTDDGKTWTSQWKIRYQRRK